MTKSVYVKHLEIPHQTKKFHTQEQARAAANHQLKNYVQHPHYLNSGTRTQRQNNSTATATPPATNVAAFAISTIALIGMLGITLTQAAAAQEKQNPRPKKHNRHHFTKEAPQTAMAEIQNGTLSFNTVL